MTHHTEGHEAPLDPEGGWTADHLQSYVATGGADGHMWRGVPTLLLTTRGRKSGRLRRTPLIYGEDGGGYLVVASKGGTPRHPAWYLNLRDDPVVSIQVADRVMDATARTATAAEKPELWRTMTTIWPDYDDYQSKTDRDIPVVVIEPS